MIDTGIKRSIVRQLRARGARAHAPPVHGRPPESCSRAAPDAMFLANGPGDPGRARLHRRHGARARRAACRSSASASGTSCSAARSASRPTSCRFGHRGANHPVKDLETGRDRDHQPEPRLRRARPGRRAHDRRRRAGALGDRLRRRRADARQPLRPHRRGAAPARRPGRAPSSTTPRPGPARTTRCYLFDRFVDADAAADAPARRHPQDPDPRLRADRDRPGRRVRLLRRAGLQGAARGGLRGRPRQLQPGDDHDRPGVRRRAPTSSRCCPGRSRRSSSASAPTRCCRRSAARPR